MQHRHPGRALFATFALACLCAGAGAQDFPTKPLRIVAPFPPGGASDAALRGLADRLRVELGQPIIVDNRPGAGTAIASEYVAKAPADGYTLLFAGSSLTILPAFSKVNYNPTRDFAPISQVLDLATFLVVRSDVPVKNVGEFVAYLKERKGSLNFGTVGAGSITHMQMEQFKALTQTDALHVPYKGSAQVLTDLIGGRLQFAFDGYATVGPYVQNGTLRALAVAMPHRSTALPDVPTLREAGIPGYDVVAWSAILAPAGTPKPIVEKLNGAIRLALRDPGLASSFRAFGGEPLGSTPEELGARIQRDTRKMAEMARSIGVVPE